MASGDATRGLATGNPHQSQAEVIDYWSTQSGNAADFGDLTQNIEGRAQGRQILRAIFGGGYQDGGLTYTNIIDYVTVQTTGDATDFGDLLSTAATNIGLSNATYGHWNWRY